MNKEELIEHLRHRHPGIRGVRDPIASEYDRSLLDRWHAEDHERHGEHSDVLLRRRQALTDQTANREETS